MKTVLMRFVGDADFVPNHIIQIAADTIGDVFNCLGESIDHAIAWTWPRA